MKFAYSWKSSDGFRNEDEIEAPNKESAFATLRERGIRPIKVVPVAPRRPHPLVVIIFTILVLLSAEVIGWLFWRSVAVDSDLVPRCTAASSSSYAKIVSKATALQKEFNQSMADIDFELITNLSAIEKAADTAMFRNEISKARQETQRYKSAIHSLFQPTMGEIPSSRADERLGIKVLYGRLAVSADEFEDRVNAAEAVIDLLDDNRGKWHMVGHDIVFNDQFLKKEFDLYSSADNPATARWRRDFSPKNTSDR